MSFTLDLDITTPRKGRGEPTSQNNLTGAEGKPMLYILEKGLCDTVELIFIKEL